MAKPHGPDRDPDQTRGQATPEALSNNFSFSHTPRLTGRGGGTGLLISNYWKFTPLSSPSINRSFESHSVTITYPLKINFVVVYRPPGQLVNFVEELDLLLSNFPEDGTPLVILGDFNIHLDKPLLISRVYVMLFVSYCVCHNICILLDVFFEFQITTDLLSLAAY